MSQITKEQTAADAKASFAQVLRDAEQGTPTLVTRHGRRVAAVVSIDLFEDLQRLREAGPQAGLASIAGGWAGSEEVAERALGYW